MYLQNNVVLTIPELLIVKNPGLTMVKSLLVKLSKSMQLPEYEPDKIVSDLPNGLPIVSENNNLKNNKDLLKVIPIILSINVYETYAEVLLKKKGIRVDKSIFDNVMSRDNIHIDKVLGDRPIINNYIVYLTVYDAIDLGVTFNDLDSVNLSSKLCLIHLEVSDKIVNEIIDNIDKKILYYINKIDFTNTVLTKDFINEVGTIDLTNITNNRVRKLIIEMRSITKPIFNTKYKMYIYLINNFINEFGIEPLDTELVNSKNNLYNTKIKLLTIIGNRDTLKVNVSGNDVRYNILQDIKHKLNTL